MSILKDKKQPKAENESPDLHGEQQGGNHGGGGSKGTSAGNQKVKNSAVTARRDNDGDLAHGSKGKKN